MYHLFRYLQVVPLVLFLFISFLCVFNSVAQNVHDKNRTVKIEHEVDSINNLSRELTFINPVKSLELAQRALALAENYEKGMAYAYRNIANIDILNEVYSLGTQYLGKAEEIFSSMNDSIGLADCYISYGHLYHKLQDITNEIKYFEKAYHVYSNKTFPGRLGISALNLAESYFSDKQFTKSRQLVEQAVVLSKESNITSVLSACYKLLGDLELINGNEKIAAVYFSKVLELSSNLGENSQKIVTIESLLHLSELYEKEGNIKNQFKYLKQALNYSIQYNITVPLKSNNVL